MPSGFLPLEVKTPAGLRYRDPITGRFSKSISPSMLVEFNRLLEKIAAEARKNAPTKRIKQNIKINKAGVSQVGNNLVLTGSVKVDLKAAPEARAYEYGSGIHATHGVVGTYPIRAKNVSNLHFWWERKDKWFFGPVVDHPGVEAQPYLRPALKEHKKELEIFAKYMAKDMIISLLRKGFTS